VVLGDDGTSAGIRIPSLLISKKDGDILKLRLKLKLRLMKKN
jgi:hypothetical protein